jgi:quercetin dioxygenase-like cupin family protein
VNGQRDRMAVRSLADFKPMETGVMKVVTLKNIPNVPAEGAAEQTAGWTGPVSRTRQTIIEPGDSKNYNCSVVNFSQGCNTGWHVHDCDQILIVTSGAGIVATEHEQREINVGDVGAHQGWRAPLAWRQGRYDHGAHYDHARWQSG